MKKHTRGKANITKEKYPKSMSEKKKKNYQETKQGEKNHKTENEVKF